MELRNLYSQKWYSVSDLRKIEEKSGKQYKKGKFTLKEREILSASLNEWLEDNSITMTEFLEVFFINKTTSRQSVKDKRFKELFKYLASKLDGRPVLLTYQCIRRMYHPSNGKGRFSAEEDSRLLALQTIHGSDWEEIGRRMDRYGMNCRDRYREIGTLTTNEWTPAQIECIASTATASATASVVKTTSSPSKKQWSSLAQMTEKTESQCKSKWMDCHLRSLNNGERPTWTGGLDYTFLKIVKSYLLDNPMVEDVTEIDWKFFLEEGREYIIIKDHDNGKMSFFHPYNLRDRFNILKKRVSKQQQKNLLQMLDLLIIED